MKVDIEYCGFLFFFYLRPFPSKDTPEFDLVFDNAADEWVAQSPADKSILVQVLHHGCQTYWDRKERSQEGKPGPEPQPPQLQAAPGSDARTRRHSVSPTQPAQAKTSVLPGRPEFINCQPKLTRGEPSLGRCGRCGLNRCRSRCSSAEPLGSVSGGCCLSLTIYRCKALLNCAKNVVAAKKKSARPE